MIEQGGYKQARLCESESVISSSIPDEITPPQSQIQIFILPLSPYFQINKLFKKGEDVTKN